MVHLNRLEGTALEAYLLMRRQCMLEGARVSNLTFEQAWAIPCPSPEAVTYRNLLPGPEAALKIEDLLPEDMGLSENSTTEYGYQFAALSAGENTNQVNTTISNGRVVGIYGWIDSSANPQLVQIDVNIGGREARVWPTRPGQCEINDAQYVSDPIIIPEAKKLTVDLWMATTATEKVTFLGLYVEPKG